MAYPLFTKIDVNIYNNILSHSTNNSTLVNGPTAASNLVCWVRIISGTGEGLIFYSNPSIPNIGDYDNPQFDDKGRLISITQKGSIYGNRVSSGMIGFDWNNKPVFPHLTPWTGDLVLKPGPVVTGLQIKEGKDQISRHCDLTLKCFSLAQAEVLQEYLMEPGHCLNIEFGWNTDMALAALIDTSNGSDIPTLVANRNLSNTNLQSAREKSNGDYESFFGFIVGGSLTSDDENFNLTIRLRGMPGLPTFLQSQHTILELKEVKDKNGKVIRKAIQDIPSTFTYPVVDIEKGTAGTQPAELAGERRAKWMFNKLPGNRQTPEVQKNIIEKAIDLNDDLGFYNYINFDYPVYLQMLEFISKPESGLLQGLKDLFGKEKEYQVGGLTIPKEKLVSENKYIRFGLALDILNANNGLLSYEVGGKPVTVRINTRGFIGAFPGIFSTKPSKLIIPGTIPDFYQLYCNPNTVSVEEILKAPYIDNSIPGVFMVKDATSGKKVPKRGTISFIQDVNIPLDGVDKDKYNGYYEYKGYYGLLENLYINFDVFKNAIVNSHNKSIRDVLMQMLNEMSSAVNSFWNFQLIEQEVEGKIILQIVDENWSGYLNDKDKVRTFIHSGEQSVFLEASLDVDIPSEMTNQIILKRESLMSDGSKLSYTSNPDAQCIDVGGLFSKFRDQFLTEIDKQKISKSKGKKSDSGSTDTAAKKGGTPDEIRAQIAALLKSLKKVTKTYIIYGGGGGAAGADVGGGSRNVTQYINANGDVVREIGSDNRPFTSPSVSTEAATAEGAKLLELEKALAAAESTTKTNQETALSTNLEKIDVVPNPERFVINPPTLNPAGGFVEFNKNFKIYCCEDTQLFDVLKNNAFEAYPGKEKTSHLLPIKYRFKILGRSGIQRGDTFNILGIPKKYRQNGFFQVVQVEHTLENNLWYTDVIGQYRQQSDR